MPIPEYPITREEFYLAGLVGESVETPEPITREELYLAKANGESVNVPEPITRLEKYLADIAGEDVETPNPITRKEVFLAKILGNDVDVPKPITREEMYLSELGSGSSAKTKTVTGKILHITDALDSPVKDFVVSIAPVQSGSGTPSPDNVRPIRGWAGATIYRTRKNVWDGETESGDIFVTTNGDPHNNVNRTRAKNFIPVQGNTQYHRGGGNYPNFVVAFYDADKNYPYNTQGTGWIVTSLNTPFVTPGWCRYIKFYFNASIGEYNSDISINLSASDSVYHPYEGTAYPVSWQTEADTVYGGTLDTVTGTLTVTHGQIAGYNGETLPGAWISDRDVYAARTTPTTGAQVVYELAEPVVYQLLPKQVETLLGENNIWADCGNSTMTYYADGRTNDSEALNLLLGGRYQNDGGEDEPSDKEALDIVLGVDVK